jgi:hypothetical protein
VRVCLVHFLGKRSRAYFLWKAVHGCAKEEEVEEVKEVEEKDEEGSLRLPAQGGSG